MLSRAISPVSIYIIHFLSKIISIVMTPIGYNKVRENMNMYDLTL